MRDDDCIFCKIANGEIPAATVYEDADFRVILDLGPAAKGHALILPKSHYKDICEAEHAVAEKLFPLAARVGKAMKTKLQASGFNVVQNNGTSAGQTVFHLHVHVIPRYDDGPAMVTWTPGSAEPEELKSIAESLKAAI
ncbi:MAG: HIT family protein [Lachnospiraceae bacterium]|nr:HIT family protein [Lachnospiraceae bacterium]